MRTRLLLGFSLVPVVLSSLFLPAGHAPIKARAVDFVATQTLGSQTSPDPVWDMEAEHKAMEAAQPKPPPPPPTTVPASKPVVHAAAPVVRTTYVAPAAVAPSPPGHWCYSLPDNMYARYIVAHESGCDVHAVNPRSGACGIPQFLPCRSYGWDGTAQTNAMIAYVMGRYGSWVAAYDHKISTGWY